MALNRSSLLSVFALLFLSVGCKVSPTPASAIASVSAPIPVPMPAPAAEVAEASASYALFEGTRLIAYSGLTRAAVPT